MSPVPGYGRHSLERIAANACRERDEARADLLRLRAENARLLKLIERDRTGLGIGLVQVVTIASGFDWLCEGRGPYRYDDQRYRLEVGSLITQVVDTANAALVASGALVTEAFHPRATATDAMLREDCAKAAAIGEDP